MPIYEYTCQKCRQEVEILVRGSERPECPECGSASLEKQLSVPAAHVNDSGDLPVCQPRPIAGCGAPQCGMGGCGEM